MIDIDYNCIDILAESINAWEICEKMGIPFLVLIRSSTEELSPSTKVRVKIIGMINILSVNKLTQICLGIYEVLWTSFNLSR